MGRPVKLIRAAFRQLLNPEGRRGWALALLAGGGMAMTLYAIVAMILVRGNATYVLYLGLAADIGVLITLTGFAGLLVKRTIRASGLGAEFSASDVPDEPARGAADKANEIAGEATGERATP